jgi:hypothetical protein
MLAKTVFFLLTIYFCHAIVRFRENANKEIDRRKAIDGEIL